MSAGLLHHLLKKTGRKVTLSVFFFCVSDDTLCTYYLMQICGLSDGRTVRIATSDPSAQRVARKVPCLASFTGAGKGGTHFGTLIQVCQRCLTTKQLGLTQAGHRGLRVPGGTRETGGGIMSSDYL